jgi:hypothetical protein
MPGLPTVTLEPTQFFEAAINVNLLFPNAVGPICYASFLAETRSSTSDSASLQDLVLAGFPLCAPKVQFACPDQLTQAGNQFKADVRVTVKNDGAYPVTVQSIVDKTSPNTNIIGVSVNPQNVALVVAAGTTAVFHVIYTLNTAGAFKPQLRVNFVGMDGVENDGSLQCPPAPRDFSALKSCTFGQFLDPPQGFQFQITVDVTNTAGGAQQCTVSNTGGTSPAAKTVPISGSASFQYTITTTATTPVVQDPTVTCTDPDGTNAQAPKTVSDPADCPSIVSSVTMSKVCQSGTKYAGSDGTNALFYTVKTTVTNNAVAGANQVAAPLYNCQPTDGLATADTCGTSCPGTPCGTGCTGGVIPAIAKLDPSASGDRTYTVVQAASAGTVSPVSGGLTVTPTDAAASVQCVNSAGTQITASLGATTSMTPCAVTVNPKISITKTCTVTPKAATADIPVMYLTIDSQGTVSNDGDVTLRDITLSETHTGESGGAISVPMKDGSGNPITALKATEQGRWSESYIPKSLSYTGCLKFSDTISTTAKVPLLAGTAYSDLAQKQATASCSPCPQCEPNSAFAQSSEKLVDSEMPIPHKKFNQGQLEPL